MIIKLIEAVKTPEQPKTDLIEEIITEYRDYDSDFDPDNFNRFEYSIKDDEDFDTPVVKDLMKPFAEFDFDDNTYKLKRAESGKVMITDENGKDRPAQIWKATGEDNKMSYFVMVTLPDGDFNALSKHETFSDAESALAELNPDSYIADEESTDDLYAELQNEDEEKEEVEEKEEEENDDEWKDFEFTSSDDELEKKENSEDSEDEEEDVEDFDFSEEDFD